MTTKQTLRHRPHLPLPLPRPHLTTLRPLHAQPTRPPIPRPTPFVPDTTTFLTLIGRNLLQHAPKIPSWDALFTLSSRQLRELGVEPARSRRYLLRWRDKFRHGEFGVGGDAAVVGEGDGRVEVRAVDVAAGGEVERRIGGRGEGGADDAAEREMAGLARSAGVRTVVVNAPASVATALQREQGTPAGEANKAEGGDASAAEKQEMRKARVQPLSEGALEQVAPIHGVRLQRGHGIRGPHVHVVRGSRGRVGVIRPTEGMWEHKRGQKVDGGERRKAEVRSKRRAAERKASRA